MKVTWVAQSRFDISDIHSYYLTVAGEVVAGKILDSIYYSAETIAEFPEIGVFSDTIEGVRKFGVVGYYYLIYYRVKSGEIEILSVFDTRRNPSVISKMLRAL